MHILFVRKLEREDLPTRVEWFNNPLIYRQMMLNPPFSLSETQAWFSRTLLNDTRQDFTVVDENNQIIAMAGLTGITYRDWRAELYIAVNPSLTGKGIGSRVMMWLGRYAFDYLDLKRIFLYTIAENQGARRFYERLGFRHEGTLREHSWQEGRPVDRCIYGMLKSEWKSTESSVQEFSFTI